MEGGYPKGHTAQLARDRRGEAGREGGREGLERRERERERERGEGEMDSVRCA